MNAFMAIQALSDSKVGELAKSYDTQRNGCAKRASLVLSTCQSWSNVRNWIEHLSMYIFNIVAPTKSPDESLKEAIMALTGCISAYSALETLKSKIFEDPAVHNIVHSLWTKQWLRSTRQIIYAVNASSSPPSLLSSITLHMSKCRKPDDTDFLAGKEEETIRFAFHSLRHFTNMQLSVASEKYYLLMLRECFQLLMNLLHFDCFIPHMARPKQIITVVERMKLAVSEPARQFDIDFIDLRICCFILRRTFFSPRGDISVSAALKAGLLDTLAQMSAPHLTSTSCYAKLEEGQVFVEVRLLLDYIMRSTTYRSIVPLVANATQSIVEYLPGIPKENVAHKYWNTLSRLSIERSICVWLFDEHRRRQLMKCASVCE
jgi:hypothetical protein